MHKSPQETQIEVREEEEGEEEEEEEEGEEKSIRRNMKGLPARQALKKAFLLNDFFCAYSSYFYLCSFFHILHTNKVFLQNELFHACVGGWNH